MKPRSLLSSPSIQASLLAFAAVLLPACGDDTSPSSVPQAGTGTGANSGAGSGGASVAGTGGTAGIGGSAAGAGVGGASGSSGSASGGTAGGAVGGASGASGTSGTAGSGGAGSGNGGSAGTAGSGGAAGGAGGGSGGLPWLTVDGNQLKDPAGNTVILRGVAMIDLGETEENEGGVIELIDRMTDVNDTQGNSPGFYTKVIRLAVYPHDSDAFTSPFTWEPGNTDYYDQMLRPVVDYAREKGIYAIIDWHYIDDTTPHRETTNAFWSDIAPRFANDSHVLFELFNEPINDGDWESVRTDMQAWYDTVRQSAPQNLVLVGTPNWSQIVGPTATTPINGTNVMYVAHMYPLHWGFEELRNEITTAAAVHPVFMSEWGFHEGEEEIVNGTITSYGTPFKAFVDGLGLSWTAWCASHNWFPPMFNRDGTLRVGEGEMGGFAKDWLYERRDDSQPSGG
jgi:hypothetical protein